MEHGEGMEQKWGKNCGREDGKLGEIGRIKKTKKVGGGETRENGETGKLEEKINNVRL